MAHKDELKLTKGTPTPGAVAEKSEKQKRELPRVTFTAEDVPEIKDWKVEGKYYLELEVEQVAMEKDRYGFEAEKEKPLTATFKVLAVKAMDHGSHEKEGMFPKGYKGNPNRL